MIQNTSRATICGVILVIVMCGKERVYKFLPKMALFWKVCLLSCTLNKI